MGRAVDQIVALGLGLDIAIEGLHVGGKFTHDLFQNILQRDQPLNHAIFIDHDAEAPPVALKIEQLSMQRRAFGHKIAVAEDIPDGLSGEFVPAVQQARDAAHVDDADNVVNVALIDRQAGVPAMPELRHDFIDRIIQIDRVHFTAGQHDVVHTDVFEFQDTQQHALMALGDQAAGLAHDRAQFIRRQGRIPPLVEPDADQPQEAV